MSLAEHVGLGRRAGVSKVEADGDQVRVFTREPQFVDDATVDPSMGSVFQRRR